MRSPVTYNSFARSILLNVCLLLAAGIIISGCQTAARFSSKNSKGDTGSTTGTPSKKKSPDREEDKPFYRYEPMDKTQESIVKEAKKWLGTPYCYGGESRNCTDCSGFVQRVYFTVDIKLPRTAAEQFRYAKYKDEDSRQIGDLIFFNGGSGISHVGIYIGGNEFIHASSSMGVVRQKVDDDYYRNHFAGYGRVIHSDRADN